MAVLRGRWTVLLGLVAAVLAMTAPASAHTQVLRSEPGPGAVVESPVDRVELGFSDPVRPDVRIDVLGPDGTPVAGLGTAEVGSDGRSARVAFAPLDVAGDYVVDAAFTSVDGDQLQHRYQFSVVAPSPGGHDGGGVRGTTLAGVAAFVVAVSLAVGVAVRRRARR